MDNDRRTRTVNSGQKTPLWIVAVSVAAAVLTTMLLLTGLAWVHVTPTVANIALLGTVLAGVGTAGGLVVGLLSLYVLSDVNGRVQQKLDSALRQWKDEQEKRLGPALQRVIRASSKMSVAGFQPTDVAEELMRAAIELFPELPYAREGMGQRFAKQTFSYHWNAVADFAVPQSADRAADRRVQAIRWLEEAVAADEAKKVGLEDPDAVWWDLAKLYSLAGDHTQARRALDCVKDIQGRKVGPVDMTMLLHEVSSLDKAREVCRAVDWSPIEEVPFSAGDSRWLVLVISQRSGNFGSPAFGPMVMTTSKRIANKSESYHAYINGRPTNGVKIDEATEAEARERLRELAPLIIGNLDHAYGESVEAKMWARLAMRGLKEPEGPYAEDP